jgi:putative membrane protein
MEDDKNIAGKRLNPSDHLANERTFLAWIRTSIALMGFGFVVVKFALFLKRLSLLFDKPGIIVPTKGYSSETGIFLVGTGITMALYSYFRYRITEKQLLDNEYKSSYLLTTLVTALIFVAGTILVIFLLPNLKD